MDKLKMHSLNGQQQALKQLQALFPACVTEQQTAAGEAQLAVDFDRSAAPGARR